MLVLFLSSCAEKTIINWQMKNVHQVDCPENADERACTVVDLNYPVFSGDYSDSLNALMLRTLCFNLADDSPCESVESIAVNFIDEFKTIPQELTGASSGWELSQTISIINENAKIIALQHEFYAYTGGAHGMPGQFFINIEKNSGQVLSLADILSSEEHAAFLNIAKSKFYEQRELPADQSLGQAGYWFNDETFYVPDNFSITGDGLLFLYNPYEIASYADGMIELFVPFTDVHELLQMEKLK